MFTEQLLCPRSPGDGSEPGQPNGAHVLVAEKDADPNQEASRTEWRMVNLRESEVGEGGGGAGMLNTVEKAPLGWGNWSRGLKEGRVPATGTWGEQHPGEGNGNAKATRQEGAGSSEQRQWYRGSQRADGIHQSHSKG